MKEIIVNNDMKISQVVAGCMRVADANLTGHQFFNICRRMYGDGNYNI